MIHLRVARPDWHVVVARLRDRVVAWLALERLSRFCAGGGARRADSAARRRPPWLRHGTRSRRARAAFMFAFMSVSMGAGWALWPLIALAGNAAFLPRGDRNRRALPR